jgi:hypothetical protein
VGDPFPALRKLSIPVAHRRPSVVQTFTEEISMRFLLLLHGDEAAEDALTSDQRRSIVDEHIAFSRQLRDAGQMVLGEPLGPSRQGKIVRNRGVTDGPFAETKEQLGGFYVIEVGSMEDALEIAHRVPAGPGLAVEVRPIPEV